LYRSDIRNGRISLSKNLGLDLAVLKNKLTVSHLICLKETLDNMIVPQEGIPLTLGAGAPLGNYGALVNKEVGS
jgi:hypothetical protein